MFVGPRGEAAVEARTPAAADLKRFFYPESVALLGASGTAGKLGYNVLWNLRRHGFQGRIYPINPRSAEVQGVKAYASVEALPEPPDVGLVIVPAEGVPAASWRPSATRWTSAKRTSSNIWARTGTST
jgi:predicted CoA-binding protein